MVLSDAEKLGAYIVAIKKDVDSIKSNALPEETDQSINLAPFDKIKVTLSQTTYKRYYPTNSFIIDHPVYGDIDSSTLALDGGYQDEGASFPMAFPIDFDENKGRILFSTYNS